MRIAYWLLGVFGRAHNRVERWIDWHTDYDVRIRRVSDMPLLTPTKTPFLNILRRRKCDTSHQTP